MSNLTDGNVPVCCFCSGNEFLIIPNPHEDIDVYITMIMECFRIKISIDTIEDCETNRTICKSCVSRLKDAVRFRQQFESAYERINDFARQHGRYATTWNTKMNKQKKTSDEEDAFNNLNLNYTLMCSVNCCCCSSQDELSSILEPLDSERAPEIITSVIAECFQIKPITPIEDADKNLYMICKKCIYRLKNALHLRFQVQIVCKAIKSLNKKHLHRDEHTKEHHSDHRNQQDGDFVCTNCEKTFKHKRYLRQHMKIHVNNRRFVCDVCGKSYIRKQEHQNHMLSSHLKTKNEKCPVCGKLFTLKPVLTQHMKIHSNVKNFICDLCERAFIRKTKLREHIQSHMGVKRAACKFCGKKFASNSNLKRHVNTLHKCIF